jgi:predicted phosphate transport protein (TIGR00153 family)
MARFSLIPKEEAFFTDFEVMAGHVQQGAETLQAMIAVSPVALDKAPVIKDLEHTCDECTRSVIDRLNRTFVTPLDREDIYALAVSLDDVMDKMDAAAAIIRLYRITEARAGALRLAEIITDSVKLLHDAFRRIDKRTGILELSARVNQLEHEADRVHQDAVVALFDEEQHDPVAIIKWKEILDALQEATDCCKDVADTLAGVVVKHG